MNAWLRPWCALASRPLVLFWLAALLLALLWLLRGVLWGVFLLYLALLVLLGLLGLMRVLGGVLRKLCRKAGAAPKGAGSEGHPPSKGIHIPPHTYKRPDPMIYSQYWLMAQGLAITWNNPDIELLDGGVAADSASLLPGHAYDIRARIWNGSTDAPAVNLTVRFYYLSFGVDTVRHYIGETHVDVPVKGSPLGPAVATMPWTTPPAGHYCIQVELHWIDDANPFNNLGQENVDVKKLNSPNASFTFAVRNTSPRPRTYTLRADAYELPERPLCPPPAPPARTRDTDPYARHRPAAHPLPEGWQVDWGGRQTLHLAPGEQVDVTVKITATEGFAGRRPVNINAFDGDALVGGVTLYVHH